MSEILRRISEHPVATRLALTGPMIVARDAAHARLYQRAVEGKGLPDYFKEHPIYYAGPAKTPAGFVSGSFGPTTSQRMDDYVGLFQSLGGSMVMVGKGNRALGVAAACRQHGGFYLGSIGGPAALLAKNHIRKMETIDYPDLAMEAVRRIEVVDFPAFILIDDKGSDFYSGITNSACAECLAGRRPTEVTDQVRF